MTTAMKRRQFIALLGGAAASSTSFRCMARAQQSAMPVIGFLRSTTLADSGYIVAAFREGLKEAGFVEGENVKVEYRYADNQKERLTAMALDLVREGVAVIVGNFEAARAAKQATTTTPIVFAFGGDPVQGGLVATLNRPGGNITGVTSLNSTLGAKRLELLHELVPNAATLAMLVNPGSRTTDVERTEVEAAARAMGLQIAIQNVRSEDDIKAAFEGFKRNGAGGVLVGAGAFLNSYRERVVALAAQYGLPAGYNLRDFVVDGGLISYGPSITDTYRQAAIYTARILRGVQAADLPVMQSTKFEFAINLKTAKSLGLTVPLVMQMTADEVIE